MGIALPQTNNWADFRPQLPQIFTEIFGKKEGQFYMATIDGQQQIVQLVISRSMADDEAFINVYYTKEGQPTALPITGVSYVGLTIEVLQQIITGNGIILDLYQPLSEDENY